MSGHSALATTACGRLTRPAEKKPYRTLKTMTLAVESTASQQKMRMLQHAVATMTAFRAPTRSAKPPSSWWERSAGFENWGKGGEGTARIYNAPEESSGVHKRE